MVAIYLACIACGALHQALLAILRQLNVAQRFSVLSGCHPPARQHPEEMRIRVLSSVSAGAQFVVNVVVRAAGALTPSALARSLCEVAVHAHNNASTGAIPLGSSYACLAHRKCLALMPCDVQ